jgi:hypothetical protein
MLIATKTPCDFGLNAELSDPASSAPDWLQDAKNLVEKL